MAADEKVRITFPPDGATGAIVKALGARGMTVLIGNNDGKSGSNVIYGKEYAITDDALTVADSMSFTVSNIDGENAGKFFVGQRVEVEESHPDVANGDWRRQFTGRITSLQPASEAAGGGSVVVVGCMDLGWHLTSCAAPPLLKTGNKGTLQKLLSGYTDPKSGRKVPGLIDSSWGFDSTDPTNTNGLNAELKQGRAGISRVYAKMNNVKAILPYIQVEPGQTAFEVLGPYLTRLGLLMNVGAKGEIVLFRPTYTRESSHALHYHRSNEATRAKNNVLGRPTLRDSIEGYATEVQCWSTIVIPPKVQYSEDPNAQYRRATYRPADASLPFECRKVFSDSEAINPDMRKARAVHRLQMDQLNAWEYACEVQGHVARDARSRTSFFTSDMTVDVDDSVNGVEAASYWVQRVRKTITNDGSKTQLTIRKPVLDPTLTAQTGSTKRAAKSSYQKAREQMG